MDPTDTPCCPCCNSPCCCCCEKFVPNYEIRDRPKRIQLNKIYWCDCRPPLDKRECEVCKNRAARAEKNEQHEEPEGNDEEGNEAIKNSS